ncbi:MAG: enoyl-CoA hydratase-related protein [Acidimicrobiales bacterium]|jgi:enoyl-CoA hydratase/carnithine racemase|nr:enoyl-CoA hydratase-related protein [Acidimicrobiales bacterium]HJL98475.1 enoyl-CoA hydratase-related protein [Acidimicrobiales bacterium]
MSDPVIVTEDLGRVRVITINRPQALNSMNNAVMAGIRDALAAAETDNEVAVAVVTGEGRAFSAGADLQEMQDGLSGENGEDHQFPAMLKQLTEFKKPLIAAVNGLGVGIGMTFLAHCDLVLMSTAARLRTPFPQLGLAPEAGSSYTFATRMGWQNAAYVLMSGRWFSAEECLDMGLVWKVCEPESLMSEAVAVADELAANPIPSLVATKELLMGAGRPDEAWAAHKREVSAYATLLGAPANTEAVAAFVEKRDPNFSSIPGI